MATKNRKAVVLALPSTTLANSNSRSGSQYGVAHVTVPIIREMKGVEPISALTAYDYTMARLLDSAGVEILLVGDSLSTVIQGNPNTLPVTLDQMIYHCRCVVRGTSRALVVGDMPFMSYQVSPQQALESAGRLLKEGGVAAVKLEGGISVAPMIEAITRCDIPVIGHVGLTPQSFHRMGGHKKQGRSNGDIGEPGSRARVIEDARQVQAAGAFAVVLEGIPDLLAQEITGLLDIPTIGIGAGAGCDGQILVINDMLGMDESFNPSFVKRFAEIGATTRAAVVEYVGAVKNGEFPGGAVSQLIPNKTDKKRARI